MGVPASAIKRGPSMCRQHIYSVHGKSDRGRERRNTRKCVNSPTSITTNTYLVLHFLLSAFFDRTTFSCTWDHIRPIVDDLPISLLLFFRFVILEFHIRRSLPDWDLSSYVRYHLSIILFLFLGAGRGKREAARLQKRTLLFSSHASVDAAVKNKRRRGDG